MNLTRARSKRNRLKPDLELPIVLKKDGNVKMFKGVFNGSCVVVHDVEDMKTLVKKGYFGKGCLSKSYPKFQHEQKEELKFNQFQHRTLYFDKNNIPRKVKITSETTEPSHYELDYSGQLEVLCLFLEEAFFLANIVQCLTITKDDKVLSCDELWEIFRISQPNFVSNYVVYLYFRAKHFVVKPGMKFGGEYVLYKIGPEFYHSSYIVIVDAVDQNGQRITSITKRSLNDIALLGLSRLAESTAKELLVCRIEWPGNNEINYRDVSSIEIEEIVYRRKSNLQENK